MALFDSIRQGAKDVAQNAKDLADTTRINSRIADENRKIAALYAQIGKLYYETVAIEADTPLGELCLEVNAAKERIVKHNEDIRRIKEEADERAANRQALNTAAPNGGDKRCPTCGAYVNDDMLFCVSCGTKFDAPATVSPNASTANQCVNCGATLSDGAAFCSNCGSKVEALPPSSEITGGEQASANSPAAAQVLETPQKRVCVGCGAEVADGFKFCMACGQQYE